MGGSILYVCLVCCQRTGFPPSAQTKGSGSPVPSVEEAVVEKSQQEPPGEARPQTPPTRSEAFEDFKKGRGCEINKILLTNKGN